MTIRFLIVLACCAMATPAQVILDPGFAFGFDAGLKRYLELTDDQVSKIEANNQEENRRQGEQLSRIQALSREAAAELNKPAPDAMIVGLRYAEQERICRDRFRAGADLRERNRALLTNAQRQRLATLEESARLMSLVNEAQSANLYRSPPGLGGFASFLLGGVGSGVGQAFPTAPTGLAGPGCGFGFPFPGNIIPIGRIVLP